MVHFAGPARMIRIVKDGSARRCRCALPTGRLHRTLNQQTGGP
jgi:hypothetical protein